MNAISLLTRRRSANPTLESAPTEGSVESPERMTGLEIIGQEVVPVPVIPLTPSAEGGNGFEALAGDQQLALIQRGDVSRDGGCELVGGQGAHRDVYHEVKRLRLRWLSALQWLRMVKERRMEMKVL